MSGAALATSVSNYEIRLPAGGGKTLISVGVPIDLSANLASGNIELPWAEGDVGSSPVTGYEIHSSTTSKPQEFTEIASLL